MPGVNGKRPQKNRRERLLLAVGPIAVVAITTALILWSGRELLSQPTPLRPILSTSEPGQPTQSTLPSANPTLSPTGLPTTPSPSGTAPVSPEVVPTPTATPTAIPTATSTPATAVTPTAGPTASSILLDAANTDRYELAPGTAAHPHGLVILDNTAYLIDASELVTIPLQEGGQAGRIFPPGGEVEGLTVGELTALTLDSGGGALLLLDKRGDLYRYDPAADQWGVERAMDQRRTAPNPVPVAVASYNGRTYLLDEGYSQVWRHPFGDGVAEGYLPGGAAPWGRVGTALDLTRGVDLGVDGDVFVLLREGNSGPAGLARFTGTAPERDTSFVLELETPTRLYVDPEGEGPLYVIDRGGKRLQAVDPETGEILQTLTFAAEAVEMRAVYAQQGRLYISTPDALYLFPGTGQVHPTTGGQGPSERPDHLERLYSLPPFFLPLNGIRYLPERDSLMPGAPRVYRYGIHQGWDIYGGMVGTDIPYGMPVYAVAEGQVIRADHGFQEMTPAEWRDLLTLCSELHQTPTDMLDRLRGRQIWLDHGNGLQTRYVHLSGIAEDVITGTRVTQGQLIGFVGNSGTSDGVYGSEQGAHLHLEISLNGHYLGKWLSLLEVRRLLDRLFFP